MLKRILGFGLMIVFVVGVVGSASWAIPQMISFSGRLTQADGAPLADGTYPMTFSIWVEGEQSPRWGQGYNAEVTNGILNLTLGDQAGNPIPADIFDDENVSLQINMQAGNTDPQDALAPRQRLVSVPYAFRAAVADSVPFGVLTADVFVDTGVGVWTESGEDVYRDTGNVGIGTASPTKAKLMAVGTPRGVIGFNGDYAQNDTGVYGLLGGSTRLLAPNVFITGTYKLGTYGQVDSDTYGYLGYYYKAQNALLATRYGVYGKGATAGKFDGNVQIETGAVPLTFRETDQTGAGSLWRMPLDGKKLRFDASQNGTDFTGYITPLAMTSDGNVGIGTTDPTQKLHVITTSTTNFDSAIRGEATDWGDVTVYGGHFIANGRYGRGVGVYAAGLNGYGVHSYASGSNSTGVYGWGGNYDFLAAGPGTNYGAVSSIRWKRNIMPIDNSLSKVLSLRGVYFDWIKEKGGEHDVGMIAEEVGKVLPEIVNYESDGSGYTSGMDYSKLTPVLVEAIKEQQKQIEELRGEISKLKLQLAVEK